MSNDQAIAESTTKVYLSNIGVIVRSMGFKDVPNAITTGEWLQNSQQIIEHLNRIKNLEHTQEHAYDNHSLPRRKTCLPPWWMPTAKKPTS